MIEQNHQLPPWLTGLIRDFYQEALKDEIIGYQFRKISDFDHHIDKIIFFWAWRLIPDQAKLHYGSDKTYQFAFRRNHFKLNINYGEIGRWLVLFKKWIELYQVKYPQDHKILQDWLHKAEELGEVLKKSS